MSFKLYHKNSKFFRFSLTLIIFFELSEFAFDLNSSLFLFYPKIKKSTVYLNVFHIGFMLDNIEKLRLIDIIQLTTIPQL